MSLITSNNQGVSVPGPGDSGLYTEAELDLLIYTNGWVPVASAAELTAIRTTQTRTMGVGTKYEGSYAIGPTKKHVQVKHIALTGTWSPIGSTASPITLQYDGNELNITGLSVTVAVQGAGMFGSCTSAAVLKNITIVSGAISSGTSEVGLLCGRVADTNTIIDNCVVSGTVSISPATSYAGGIVGTNYGTITNSSFTGTVTANGASYVGGIAGINNGPISNCVVSGSVFAYSFIGGFVGTNVSPAVILDSYYTGGTVTSIRSGVNTSAGGFVGQNTGYIGRCYSTGTYSSAAAGRAAGCFVGNNQLGHVRDCWTSIIGSTTTSTDVGCFVGTNASGLTLSCFSYGRMLGGGVYKGFCGTAGTATNCYWDTVTSQTTSSNGGTGKTTTELKQALIPDTTTFVLWDPQVWDALTTADYPVLKTGVSYTEFVFNTTYNGSTFSPSITTSDASLATWYVEGYGAQATNNPTFNMSGNVLSRKVTVQLKDFTKLTSILMAGYYVQGTVDFSLFTKCISFQFYTNSGITSVTNPFNDEILTTYYSIATGISSLDMSRFSKLGGNFQSQDCPNLTTVSFAASTQNINLFDISNCNLSGLDISGLSNIGGTIRFNNNPNLATLLLPTSSRAITLFGAYSIKAATINASGLTGLGGNTSFALNTFLTSLTLPTSSQVFIYFHVYGCTGLTTLDLSGLTSLGGNIQFEDCTNLTSLTLPTSSQTITYFYAYNTKLTGTLDLSGLTGLGGRVEMYGNSLLTSIINPTSNKVFDFYTVSNCNLTGTLDLSTLTGLGGVLSFQNNPLLTSIINPTSSTIITTYRADTCNLTGTLNLSGLTGLGGTFYVSYNPLLTSIVNPTSSRTFVNYLAAYCNLTGTLDLSGLTGLAAVFDVSYNPLMTSATLPVTAGNFDLMNFTATAVGVMAWANMNGAQVSIQLGNCGMTSAESDETIVLIDTNIAWGTGSKQLNLSGTNGALTDGSGTGFNGLAAKTSLQAKGVTVVSN